MADKKIIKLNHYLEYGFLRGVFGLLSLLSYSMRYKFILGVIILLSKISKTIPKRILGALHVAFPTADPEWIQKIYQENLRFLARMAVDFEEGPRMKENFMKEHFVYEPNQDSFQKMCNQGGILILGHLGNWETNGVAITRILEHNDLYVLAKRQSNLLTNDWIERTRGAKNIKLIYTDESPRIILSLLKKGNLVAFIADQDAGKTGMFLPFLGKLASTFLGPAVFARNTKAPIHFMWSRYDSSGKISFGFQPLERPTLDPKQDVDQWEKEFTYNWVKLLESKIKEHPSSYFWLHRRWKRQPDNPEEVWEYWKKYSQGN